MGNFFEDVIQPDPRCHSTQPISDPALLEPNTRAAVQAIIADAATNEMTLMIFETYRSQERQALLFSQGVTQLKTVGVHHYGLACDLVKSVNGEPNWKGDFSLIGHLAQAHGLVWGGDWGRPDLPHSFRDYPHVQRCSVADQARLFRGEWYPNDTYNPYGDAGAASGGNGAGAVSGSNGAGAVSGSNAGALVYRLANPVMTGDKVRQIQQALTAAGFDTGVADGEFGPQTQTAVIAFQNSKGLPADGTVGPTTAAALGVQL